MHAFTTSSPMRAESHAEKKQRNEIETTHRSICASFQFHACRDSTRMGLAQCGSTVHDTQQTRDMLTAPYCLPTARF
jgi:hypothetical protein